MGKTDMQSDNSPSLSTESEASKLLEQALMQMDGIISGNVASLMSHSPDYDMPLGVNDAANTLVALLHSSSALPPPDPSVVKPILQWLQTSSEFDEKLKKLLTEKENLQLQVQVLVEQVDAQSSKILDLEKQLQEKKQLLSETENKLQREVLSRSSLETQKLELMSALSEFKLRQAALEKENVELRQSKVCFKSDIKRTPTSSRVLPSGNRYYTDDHLHAQTSPNRREQIDVYYGSLPRQQYLRSDIGGIDANANIADNSRKNEADSPDHSSGLSKSKGLKSILGKMKRSNSGNLEDMPSAREFQRGGVRATATARLGCSEPHLSVPPNKPFAEWDVDNVCNWLEDLGLEQYVISAKRWVKSGQQLLEASVGELEKELGIKNSLHLKKLHLALIDSEKNSSSDPFLSRAGKLDTVWVLRWLDDAGLPQHKESFLVNRVDGRVLHRLTLDDLNLLHVSSLLHVISIKRGIQVLRENDYNPDCLQRRSLPDDPPNPNPRQISQWTSHRVMEWLKAVDLAEYAPNLRGAGVHGGLMVYEPKFTAELLAALLSIPPGKTLLRRHLSTRFKELLGKDIIQDKREAEAVAGYTPLTPTLKLKVPKKSQFSLKKKKTKDESNDYGDLVCPMNPNASDDDYGKPKSIGCLPTR